MSNVIDEFEIVSPVARDLTAQAERLRAAPVPSEIWLTWDTYFGVKVSGWRPLNNNERESLIALLEQAHRRGPDFSIQLMQGYEIGEVGFFIDVTLKDILALNVQVHG